MMVMASSLLKASFLLALLPPAPQCLTPRRRSQHYCCSPAQIPHHVMWVGPKCCLLMEEKERRMTAASKYQISWMAKHPGK